MGLDKIVEPMVLYGFRYSWIHTHTLTCTGNKGGNKGHALEIEFSKLPPPFPTVTPVF